MTQCLQQAVAALRDASPDATALAEAAFRRGRTMLLSPQRQRLSFEWVLGRAGVQPAVY